MNKYLKWGIGLFLTPFVIILLLAVALYLPPIQNWAVKKAAEIASEKTGMDISVEHVCLVFPLDLGVDGVLVMQPNDTVPQKNDTIAAIKRTVVDVQLLPLLDSQVEVDALELYDMVVNTVDFVPQACVKGKLDLLSMESHGINLNAETVRLDNAFIGGAKLDICLADSVPEDTTTTENHWKISLDDLKVENSDITVHMPGNKMQVNAVIGKLQAQRGYFDLFEGLYQLGSAKLLEGKVNYDNNLEPFANGLDANHIALSGIEVDIDTLSFCSPHMLVNIADCRMKEKSGISIDTLRANVLMDSTSVCVKGLLCTPYSRANADVNLDFDAFEEVNPGRVEADVDATIGKQDLLLGMGFMPEKFQNEWPAKPLALKVKAKGNLVHMDLPEAYAELPGAFLVKLNGSADNLSDMNRLRGAFHADAHTYNLEFVKSLLEPDMRKMIGLPQMHAVADVKINGPKYDADFLLTEGIGKLKGKATFDSKAMNYMASLDANSLQLQHFVRGMGLGAFSGKANLKGSGTDFFSPRTSLSANASINHFKYDKWNLDGVKLDALLSAGKARATLESHNELLNGVLGIDALMSRNPLQATVTADLRNIDLYHLALAEAPLAIGACGHLDIATDLNDFYKLQGSVSDLTIRDSANVYRPDDMIIDVLTRRDTTHAVVDCGDFHLNGDVSGGYKYLMNLSDVLSKEVGRQWDNRIIDEKALRSKFPLGHIYLSAGRENPVSRIAKRFDVDYAKIFMNMDFSPLQGINGELSIDTLVASGVQLDAIRGVTYSDSERMNYSLDIQNGKDNPQYCFHAQAKGHIQPNGTAANLTVDDADNRQVVFLGASAQMENEGIRFRLDDCAQVLGYKSFAVNKDNYLFLSRDMRVSADMKLKANDGMGVQIYTDDENVAALQDITVSLHRFNLKEVLSRIPYMPDMSGVLDGDFHMIQTPDELSVSSSVELQDFVYENSPIGNLASEFVYMPMEDGTHHINGILMKDDMEIANVIGSYNPENGGIIDMEFSMNKLPLDMVNGFVPQHLVGLEGTGEGSVTIRGSVNAPDVSGEIYLEKAALLSVPYGIRLRFDDDPVRIENSRLLFENFQMYAPNNQPLVVMGDVDFSNLDRIMVDMRMKARNFLLIDAKETRRSEAYGKAFVNFNATVLGDLSHLRVNGNMDVLSSTDLYYILRDSPITTDNRLKELVTFTDLNSDEEIMMTRPAVDGIDVNFTVSVIEGAHITCWLNTNHSNYLDIIGGGDLRMRYRNDNLSLVGRYTISDGEMKYSLPIIPLKTFNIKEGSYIEFTGDMMNPRLNITATEENKASVDVDGVSQSVLFNCGVMLSKTLQDMGLEFIIDAPENSAVSDELKQKSIEERGKIAVTMLTTGMYLTEDNTSSFTMNSALSSFLQQEINQLAGNALRTLDLSVGMENSYDETGRMHTDYSFKFAKRFWNNRLSIAVGGKLSTGPDVSGQNSTFFDNVEVQYRTSDTSNQYLQLFYKDAVYDYLEGYVGEYGAGYLWKRKLQSLSDIFNFGRKNKIDTSLLRMRNDSSAVNMNDSTVTENEKQ